MLNYSSLTHDVVFVFFVDFLNFFVFFVISIERVKEKKTKIEQSMKNIEVVVLQSVGYSTRVDDFRSPVQKKSGEGSMNEEEGSCSV